MCCLKKYHQIFSGDIALAKGFPAINDITIFFDRHNFMKEIVLPFTSVRFYKNGSSIIQELTYYEKKISKIEIEENYKIHSRTTYNGYFW